MVLDFYYDSYLLGDSSFFTEMKCLNLDGFLRSIREHRSSHSLHLLLLSQSPESACTPNVSKKPLSETALWGFGAFSPSMHESNDATGSWGLEDSGISVRVP